jgi:4-hydroxybenzoate polyprenyltransferase
VLFGSADRLIIGLLQLATLALLIWVGLMASLGGFFWLGVVGMAATFAHQQRLIVHRERDRCFQAFLNNHWSGLLVFAGIALSEWPVAG